MIDWIEVRMNSPEFDLFNQVAISLYEKESPRWRLGHEPSIQHLHSCSVGLLDGKPVVRYAIYDNPQLLYNGEKAFTVGSWECIENQEVATLALHRAVQQVKSLNGTYLIGPMEGSTWNSYRFSLSSEPVQFFSEPYHHLYYNEQFKSAGFEEISRYLSQYDDKMDYDRKSIKEKQAEFIENGAIFRKLNISDIQNDLFKIANFCNDSFSNNFLFTPIIPEQFVEKYAQLVPFFDLDLIWIVEDDQREIHAIILNIPNHFDKVNKTFIVKTLARKPNSKFKGIGMHLAGLAYLKALDNGYKKAIHAFMIYDNASVNISNKYGEDAEMKEYALYGIKV